ncbi:MAG TPA: preprotein translocase subunit SecY [Micropepsaceae bacterium]|jgi:preprotein translocase subunit SecY|nr:preprotein translocase subunit SecY [Micropepsaceae bacterium]
MPSAAEQLASNFNLSAFSKATELKQRIFFTMVALIVARLGSYVPMPGIDPNELARQFQQQQGGLLDVFNVLAGGAIGRMAIFALGIMPYISSSIIIQLMTTVSPTLEQLKKEGEAGRKQINQYTRYGTVMLAAVQAYAIAIGLEQWGTVVVAPGLAFRMSTVITLTGGTIFLMWLGEQITARGVGNGISLIIMAGIIARVPALLIGVFEQTRTGALNVTMVVFMFVLFVGLIGGVVFMERAQRRLLVQYPKRQQGNRVFGGESSHLPLKLNVAGVIPPIFASSLLLLPMTLANFNATNIPDWLQAIVVLLGHGKPLFILLYAFGIIFFCFFYTAIVFNPEETADNLKKYGGFIPGIRPGKRTAEYIDYVLTRITVVGAIYLSTVCLIPEIIDGVYNVQQFSFGGTSILIVVSVTMDTVAQIQSHLIAQQYEGLIKKARLKGARPQR